MTWLDTNADGLALMLCVFVPIGLLLIGALMIERLVEPRHERRFPHMASVTRNREQRRREAAR